MGLFKAGINVKVIPFGLNEKDKIRKEEVTLLEHAENTRLNPQFKNILVLHSTPTGWKNLTIEGADYVIGITIFETDSIPKKWVRICNSSFIDKIWVPTRFNIDTFSKAGVARNKLELMNYCIDSKKYKQIKKSRNKNFKITYIADFGDRKNLFLLLKAFNEEFIPEEPVKLFIHTTSRNKKALDEFISTNKKLIGKNVVISNYK